MLSEVFLEGLTALAFMSGAYSLPEPVPMAPRPAVEVPTMTIPDMPDPIVVWVEGDAVLSGRHVSDGPNSTRLFVDTIEGDGVYNVVCDTFSAFGLGARVTLDALNGPDGTCHIVEG